MTNMKDLAAWDDAIMAVIEAIEDEGPVPRYHRKIMKRHRKQWPTLWAALDELRKCPRD